MKLIMFMGGVETLEYFSMEIARYLEEKGYEIFWYNLLVGASEVSRLKGFFDANKSEDFIAFTFNHEGIAGEEGLYFLDSESVKDTETECGQADCNKYAFEQADDKNSSCGQADCKDSLNSQKLASTPKLTNIWDNYHVKVINMVVDHPLYYHKYHKYLPKNYHQINIDKNHFEYMRHFYPEIKNVSFLMTAGMELNKDRDILPDRPYLFMDERKYDIVFTGNFTPKYILQKSIEKMGQDYIDFYESVLTRMIKEPKETIEKIGQEALIKEIEGITEAETREAMQTMSYVDLAVRFHYRELMIRALTDLGFKLTVVGEGFEYMKLKHPENLNMLGSGNTKKCLDSISQAKISLNVMPWFKAGAHDRIFTSMLNGAVLLTDSSTFLDKEILTEENCIRYSLELLRDYEASGFDLGLIEDFGAKLRNLLEDKEKLSKMANSAYIFAKNGHTWEDRAKIIEKLFYT